MTSLSVIVASSGERSSLATALASISSQMEPGDELLVGVDRDSLCGYWTRQRMMYRAQSEALLFMDDDDVYTPGAFKEIRKEVDAHPYGLHLFTMDTSNWRDSIWDKVPHTTGLFECGNVASQIACIPRSLRLGAWGSRYEGDWDFLQSTVELNPGIEIYWHDTVICQVRPNVIT